MCEVRSKFRVSVHAKGKSPTSTERGDCCDIWPPKPDCRISRSNCCRPRAVAENRRCKEILMLRDRYSEKRQQKLTAFEPSLTTSSLSQCSSIRPSCNATLGFTIDTKSYNHTSRPQLTVDKSRSNSTQVGKISPQSSPNKNIFDLSRTKKL